MKKHIYLLLFILAGGLFGACSKDNPFDSEQDSGVGRLLTTSLSVSLQNENGPMSLRQRVRRAAPSVADFTVEFYKTGSDVAVQSYKYSQMPEIVVLPVGTYYAVAHYGDNPAAAFDSPYYKGTSNTFTIVKDEITENVEPIVCRLSNVCVSILFDDALKAAMESDAKVTVKVGTSGSLEYKLADEGRHGYFAFVEDSHTLAATFTGTVDGFLTTETKAYGDVEPGNHYSITFRLHDAGEELPGQIGDMVIVDGEVVREEDLNRDIEGWEGTGQEDNMRPQEGPGSSTPDPGPGPDQPDQPSGDGPSITAAPGVNLDGNNLMVEGMQVKLFIHSDPGIKEFICRIDSPVLEKALNEDFGGVLPTTLDLVNTPDSYREILEGLKFPTRVGGEHDVEFDMSEFIPLILTLVSDTHSQHNFILTLTDANGTTQRTLRLYN